MYGPNLTEFTSVTIRRLAWAMGADMGKAVEAIVTLLPNHINSEKVCAACKDTKKCKVCIFKSGVTTPQKLLALLK